MVNNPAVAQLNDAFAVRGVFLRVRDLNDGHAFIVELAEQPHNLFALARMQIAGGFISEQKLWISDNRSRNAYELLLPARELTRI